jgi:PAS domain S-box-containing protein
MDSLKKILLIEDETILAMVNKKALESYGYSVITVNSGEKAMGVFEKNGDIDLIVMDIDLGEGMDGTETAALILSKHDVPIIFLSSHLESEFVEKTEGIPSYGYVIKNAGIPVLEASIKTAFKLFAEKKAFQKRDENLHESEKTVLWLLDVAEEIIICVDCQGIITLLNTSGHRVLGYTSPELIGKNWFETCIPPEHRKEMEKSFADLTRGGSKNINAAKYTVLTKNGEERLISWHHALHKEDNGNITGLISSGKVIAGH